MDDRRQLEYDFLVDTQNMSVEAKQKIYSNVLHRNKPTSSDPHEDAQLTNGLSDHASEAECSFPYDPREAKPVWTQSQASASTSANSESTMKPAQKCRAEASSSSISPSNTQSQSKVLANGQQSAAKPISTPPNLLNQSQTSTAAGSTHQKQHSTTRAGAGRRHNQHQTPAFVTNQQPPVHASNSTNSHMAMGVMPPQAPPPSMEGTSMIATSSAGGMIQPTFNSNVYQNQPVFHQPPPHMMAPYGMGIQPMMQPPPMFNAGPGYVNVVTHNGASFVMPNVMNPQQQQHLQQLQQQQLLHQQLQQQHMRVPLPPHVQQQPPARIQYPNNTHQAVRPAAVPSVPHNDSSHSAHSVCSPPLSAQSVPVNVVHHTQMPPPPVNTSQIMSPSNQSHENSNVLAGGDRFVSAEHDVSVGANQLDHDDTITSEPDLEAAKSPLSEPSVESMPQSPPVVATSTTKVESPPSPTMPVSEEPMVESVKAVEHSDHDNDLKEKAADESESKKTELLVKTEAEEKPKEAAAVIEEKETTPETAPVPAGPKSWASLFVNKSAKVIVTESSPVVQSVVFDESELSNRPEVKPIHDPQLPEMKDWMLTFSARHHGPGFEPRGLFNTSNSCYINSVMQALLACPPMFHMLQEWWGLFGSRTPTSTPALDSLARFVSEFDMSGGQSQHLNGPNKVKPRRSPFSPVYLLTMAKQLRADDTTFQGKQEDAEEFMLAMLNKVQEEMEAVMDTKTKLTATAGHRDVAGKQEIVQNGVSAEQPISAEHELNTTNEDAEWQEIGPGRKTTIQRQVHVTGTPLTQILMGQLRYTNKQTGVVKDTSNIQPFFTLPVDIQNVQAIMSGPDKGKVALENALAVSLSGETVKAMNKNKEVDLRRSVCIDLLPPVLILQLKCFVYDEKLGIKKLLRPIKYSMLLEIGQQLLSRPNQPRRYKLFAVVFHHGQSSEGGHYTTDMFHGGQWRHVDDTKMSAVGLEHVLYTQPDASAHIMPYLLCYRRCDLMQQTQYSPR